MHGHYRDRELCLWYFIKPDSELRLMIYRFEDFEFDTYRMELRQDGHLVPTEPQVFSLLELLITRHDRVVSKDEINEIVWGGRFVSESALSSRIKLARKALNDNGHEQRLIKTIHNRGFRFLAEPEMQEVISAVLGTDTNSSDQKVSNISHQVEPSDISPSQSPERGQHYLRDRPTIAV